MYAAPEFPPPDSGTQEAATTRPPPPGIHFATKTNPPLSTMAWVTSKFRVKPPVSAGSAASVEHPDVFEAVTLLVGTEFHGQAKKFMLYEAYLARYLTVKLWMPVSRRGKPRTVKAFPLNPFHPRAVLSCTEAFSSPLYPYAPAITVSPETETLRPRKCITLPSLATNLAVCDHAPDVPLSNT